MNLKRKFETAVRFDSESEGILASKAVELVPRLAPNTIMKAEVTGMMFSITKRMAIPMVRALECTSAVITKLMRNSNNHWFFNDKNMFVNHGIFLTGYIAPAMMLIAKNITPNPKTPLPI